MAVAGADAARIGKRTVWAVVVLREDGSAEFRLEPDLERVLTEVELLAADVPIGLADEGVPLDKRGRRLADVEARSILGKRANTVFSAPPLEAIECHIYSEALALCPTLSSQAYHLRTRILEVRDLAKRYPETVIEYHPEVSFRALHGKPLPFNKKCWNGVALRRRLLTGAGMELPEVLAGDAGLMALDDVLDASVGALTASAALKGDGWALGGDTSSELGTKGLIWAPKPWGQ